MSSQPETYTDRGLYVRKATGLVREVSPFSALLFNVLPSVPGVGLAISVFYVFGVFPGAHLIWAFILTGVIAVLVALPFAFLSGAFPRSGGDYAIVSRSLTPPLGMASSFSLFIAVMLSVAFVAVAFARFGVVPAFQTLGLISGNDWWSNAATTLSSNGWTFVLGIGLLLVGVLLGSIRLRTAMRVQNISFAIGGLGLVIGFVVMLTVSRADFVGKFDSILGSGAHAKVLSAAQEAGVALPGTSWSNTIPVIGVLALLFLFSWWSSHYGGEVRAPRRWSIVGSMTLSVVLSIGIYIVMTLGLFHLLGKEFMAASNAVDAGVPPFWYVFVAIAAKSTFLAVVLVVTLLVWFPVWLWLQLAQPVRALFAWAYDGLLPQSVTRVSSRTHAPVMALAVTAVLSVAATAWAAFSGDFLTVLSTVTLFNLTPMFFVGLSALLLPFVKPEVWRATPFNGTFAGVPVVSIVGALACAAVAFVFYIFMHYDALGIVHPVRTVLFMAASAVAGVVFYFVAASVQRSRGVDVRLNYAEVPTD